MLPPLAALLLVAIGVVAAAAERVRPPAVAGSWYPGGRAELARTVDEALAAAPSWAPAAGERVVALIAPHAGYPFSGATAAAAYRAVRGGRYDRVVVLGPSHHTALRGIAVADVDAYETPLGTVSLDAPAVAALRASPLVQAGPADPDREHSLEMQLPFLQRALAPGWRLVPVLVGSIDEADYPVLADVLRPLLDERTLVVVSTDFTHYGARFGYMPFAPDADAGVRIRELDDAAYALVAARDARGFLAYQARTGITICGYRPVALLLQLLPGQARFERLAYATSGEQTGDRRNSVSYLAAAATVPSVAVGPAVDGSADPPLRWLHRLASLRVRDVVTGDAGAARSLRALLDERSGRAADPSGAFVTLKEGRSLRGCIGYVAPIKPLWEAVLDNAEAAALRDPRFAPVRPDELGRLTLEVSVLTDPEPIADWHDFEVGRHGVVLEKAGRRAVFLPDVATEQGWDRAQTLTQLARKAGLPPDAWREGARLSVFTNHKYAAPLE
ncbi:MAG: AmmeMemoRadiSam system protein B [Gammaproteobacteria bacterium]|nr:AmmeMemoRadiSam system protein B [Gammaproteobacteria bacterium]